MSELEWLYEIYGTREQIVLGTLLKQHWTDAYEKSIGMGLTASAFEEPDHQAVFRAMAKAVEEGHQTEVLNVYRYLEPRFATMLSDLVDNRGSLTMNIAPFVQDLLKERYRRTVKERLQDVSQTFDHDSPIETWTHAIESLSDQLPGQAPLGEKPDSFADVLGETLKGIEDQLTGARAGIPTGIKKLDQEIYGFQPGLVYLVGGRPSMGKTALAINFALTAAQKGKRVLYFTIEMPAEQIMKRMLSLLGKIDSSALQRGALTEAQQDQLMQVARDFHKLPLHVDDSSGYYLSKFLAKCRRVKRTAGLDLVVLDYVQDMVDDTHKYSGNRQAEVTVINRALKKMAKDLDLPFIGVVQVSREVDKTEKPTVPRMSDIKESGSFEQVADTVMFVHREGYYQAGGNRNFIAIAKNRHGERNKLVDIKVDLSTGFMGDP